VFRAFVLSNRQRVGNSESHDPTVVVGQLTEPLHQPRGSDLPGVPAHPVGVFGSPARQSLVRFKCAQIGESRLQRTRIAQLVESTDKTAPSKPVPLTRKNPGQIIRRVNRTQLPKRFRGATAHLRAPVGKSLDQSIHVARPLQAADPR
jgi:hypothetical protein